MPMPEGQLWYVRLEVERLDGPDAIGRQIVSIALHGENVKDAIEQAKHDVLKAINWR